MSFGGRIENRVAGRSIVPDSINSRFTGIALLIAIEEVAADANRNENQPKS